MVLEAYFALLHIAVASNLYLHLHFAVLIGDYANFAVELKVLTTRVSRTAKKKPIWPL